MNSKIYIGHLMHSRLEPIKHTFVYPVYFYSFELSDLPDLEKSLLLFGYNKVRPIAIHDQDYLGDSEGSISDKLFSFLKKKECADNIASIKMMTVAKYFNYVFNPVSFFYCYSPDNLLRCVVTEINNTYGETHLYILDNPEVDSGDYLARYRVSKEFYVSPFNDLQGDYEFYFSDLQENLDIRVNIIKEEQEVFSTRLWGKGVPLTLSNLITTLIQYPISATLAMPLITWEALVLRYKKGLQPVLKPIPTHPMTIRKAPISLNRKINRSVVSWKHKIARQFNNLIK